MQFLLTSSRKPSIRVNQFLKELYSLFPNDSCKKLNRGKKNFQSLFDYCSQLSCEYLVIVEDKKGNPGKITFYKSLDNEFKWLIDFKLTKVLLKYELSTNTMSSINNWNLNFEYVNKELERVISKIFNKLLSHKKDTLTTNETIVNFTMTHKSPGFVINFSFEDHKLSPEIWIEEIIINEEIS